MRGKNSGGVVLVLNCLRSGGAEKQLLWIAAQIVSRGMRCSIVELVAGERTERIEEMVRNAVALGVEVKRAPAGSGAWRGLGRLRRHLRDCRPGIVWSWGIRADSTSLLARGGLGSGRWLVSIRSANTRARQLSVQRFLAWCSDGVVANTRAGLRMSGIARLPGVAQWVLPNAVGGDNLTPIVLPEQVPGCLILVMLGNLKIGIKGYDLAARVARGLKERGLAFELRIAGRPDEIGALETIFRELEVDDVIKYYGEVSRPEQFLRQGHLYLLLSRFEGMPNTLLEALQVGLPAIATDVGDLRQLQDEKAPYELIPVEDAGAAVEAVVRARSNWEATRHRAALGPAWVEANFSETKCRKELFGILDQVMGRVADDRGQTTDAGGLIR